MNVLEKIVLTKRQEIEGLKREKPLEEIEREARARKVTRRPFRPLFDSRNVLIAEVKPKSPSAGDLTGSPLEIADVYSESEADAISVLTDAEYFGGSLELLEQVAKVVTQPILRKDFIIDPYQVYETALTDASAFLLIASVLSADEMRQLRDLGGE